MIVNEHLESLIGVFGRKKDLTQRMLAWMRQQEQQQKASEQELKSHHPTES